ncbi:MAG: hypothetical protein ABEJ06_02785 [Haloarculaceae archaeon]
MGLPSERRFARRLRRLSASDLAAFVAAVYAARGADVARHGRRLRVSTDAGVRTLLVVGRDPDVSGEPVDALVAARRTRRVGRVAADLDAAVVGPGDLWSMVRYALPRASAVRLCRAHIEAGPTERLAARLPAAARSVPPVAVLLAGVLLVASTLALALAGADLHEGAGRDARPQSAAGNGYPATATTAPGDGSAALPPGLDRTGVTDADALARAHAEAVAGRVYRLVTVHEGSRSAPVLVGRPAVVGSAQRRYANATQIARVAAPGTFHYTVRGTRDRSGTDRRVRYGVYADGGRSHSRLRTETGTYYWKSDVDARNGGPQAVRARRFVARYLDTSESTLARERVDGETRYRVVATGRPHRVTGPVEDYRAVASVTPAGVVRELTVTYTRTADGPEPVRFELRYDRFGQQTVFPPSWLRPARERLAAVEGTGPSHSIRYPPGLGLTGVLDADALAATHERLARDRNYRWTVVHEGSRDAARAPLGRPPALLGSGPDRYGEATAVARVAGDDRYRYAVEGTTATGSGPPAHVSVGVYADGSTVIRREGGNLTDAYHAESVDAADGNAVFADRAGRYVARALADRRSAVTPVVVDGRPHFRVRVPATPRDRSGLDYYATAVVTERGFVRSLDYERNGSVSFAFEYDHLGNATAPPPPWYGTALDRTAHDGTADDETAVPGDAGAGTGASDGGQRGPPGEDWLTSRVAGCHGLVAKHGCFTSWPAREW